MIIGIDPAVMQMNLTAFDIVELGTVNPNDIRLVPKGISVCGGILVEAGE